MFLVKRYRNDSEILKNNNNCSETKLFDRKSSPRVLSIILVSIFMLFYCVSETVYLMFSATYFQYFPLKLTASKSAQIVSAMATSYTISRGISVLIAIKIRPQLVISYHFLIIITSIIILFFGQNSITLVWVGSLSLSFGYSPVYPSIFSYINQYLVITDRIGTIFVIFHGYHYNVCTICFGHLYRKIFGRIYHIYYHNSFYKYSVIHYNSVYYLENKENLFKFDE